MLMITSLIFGVLLAANGCPLDPINCTIPYDDQLNISSDVIIDATQYCHVDNCTVKIIKTGDELNITYHDDQYHLGCTTTTLYLLEVNDNISSSYCKGNAVQSISLIHMIANYTIGMASFSVNILVFIVIIKQKKYKSLPLRLLLVSSVAWVTVYPVLWINSVTRYNVQVPNGVCIAVLITLSSCLHCANFIETEIVLMVFYTFYRCYKLYSVLSEEAIKRIFLRLVVVAITVITTLGISRVLIVVLQDISFVTSAGHCLGLPDLYEVAPITQFIGMILFSGTISVQIVFSIGSAVLFNNLSKNNNSSQANKSHKCLLKIAIIMSAVSLASGVVYYTALHIIGSYSDLVGTSVMISERCTILWMLLNKENNCKCRMICI